MKVLSMYPGQWFEHDGGLHGNEDWKSPKKVRWALPANSGWQ